MSKPMALPNSKVWLLMSVAVPATSNAPRRVQNMQNLSICHGTACEILLEVSIERQDRPALKPTSA